MQVIQCENIGLQDNIRVKGQEMAVFQRHYVGYLANKDENNGTTIIEKRNEEAEYPYISICRQDSYIKYKSRVI